VSDTLTSFVWFAVLSGVALFVAQRCGFFRVDSADHSRVTFWLFLFGALIYFAVVILSGSLLVRQIGYGWTRVVASSIGLGALLLYVGGALRGSPWGSGRFWPAVSVGALTWLVAFPVAKAVGQLFDLAIQVPQVDQVAVREIKGLLGNPWLFGFTSFTAIAIIPVTEELLFRGLLQGWISRFLPAGWAILLASLLFAAAHYAPSQGASNVIIIAQLFILGLFLGHLYRRQRSLWACISLHALFNLVTLALLWILDAAGVSV
jgi:membrane protease YdiL (CAAX protease family)